MDFSKFKDFNEVKKEALAIFEIVVEEAKKIKDVNVDMVKQGFDKWFVDYLKKDYLQFEGRISRRKYWMFALYSIMIGIALYIISLILPFLSILSSIYFLAILIPSVGLAVRRLHDINLSGWFFLVTIIPYLGAIALVMLFCLPGDNKANTYGSSEKSK